MSKIPKPPKMPGVSGNKNASNFLNKSDVQGGHNRSQHVGKTGAQLVGRNLPTATSFLSKSDQNMATRSVLASPQTTQTSKQVGKGGMNNKQAVTVPTSGGRLKPIAKVAVKNKDGTTSVFNAKVTSTTMVMKKGPQGVRAQTTFPETGTVLPKPLPGGKVPANKVSINKVGPGAQGQLRKVGAPADKPLNLMNNDGNTQKRFKGVTKNAK